MHKRTFTVRPSLPSPEFFSPAVVDNSTPWNRMSYTNNEEEQAAEHFELTPPARHTAGELLLLLSRKQTVAFLFCVAVVMKGRLW